MKYYGLSLMCPIGTERIRILVYVITTDNSLWKVLRKEYTFRNQHLRREIIVVIVTDSNDVFCSPLLHSDLL